MDLLSPQVHFLIRDKYKFKSKTGGIFSIILLILSFQIIYYHLYQYFQMKNYDTELDVSGFYETGRLSLYIMTEINKDVNNFIYTNFSNNINITKCDKELFNEYNRNINFSYECYETIDIIPNFNFTLSFLNESKGFTSLKDNFIYHLKYLDYDEINRTYYNKTYEFNNHLFSKKIFYFDEVKLIEYIEFDIYYKRYLELMRTNDEENDDSIEFISIFEFKQTRTKSYKYENLFQVVQKIFYYITIIYIIFNIFNNYLSDYNFMKYILLIYKIKNNELFNYISINDSSRKIIEVENKRVIYLDKYYNMINYIKYYIAYRFTKDTNEIKYFETIHNELIKFISIESLLENMQVLTDDYSLSKFDYFNYCYFFRFNKNVKLNNIAGKILTTLYVILSSLIIFYFSDTKMFHRKTNTFYRIYDYENDLPKFDIRVSLELSDQELNNHKVLNYWVNNTKKISYNDNHCYKYTESNYYSCNYIIKNISYYDILMINKDFKARISLLQGDYYYDTEISDAVLSINIYTYDYGFFFSNEKTYFHLSKYKNIDNNNDFITIRFNKEFINRYIFKGYKIVDIISWISPIIIIIKMILIMINNLFFDYYYINYINDENNKLGFMDYVLFKLGYSNKKSFISTFRCAISLEKVLNFNNKNKDLDQSIKISDFDLIYSHQSLYIKNKQFFKTNLGGIMYIIYFIISIFSFFNFGWDFFTRSNPKLSVNYLPYTDLDKFNFTMDVPFSYSYSKELNDYFNLISSSHKNYHMKECKNIKNDSLYSVCSNLNEIKNIITNYDNYFNFQFKLDCKNKNENSCNKKEMPIYKDELNIFNLHKFDYNHPTKYLKSNNITFSRNFSYLDYKGLDITLNHNLLIVKDNILWDSQCIKKFISLENVSTETNEFIINNSYYVTIITLTYEKLIDFLCKYISNINLYFTIFQSFYFFFANYYYKKYILDISIDKIDINKFNNVDRKDLIESYNLKNYLLSIICISRIKKCYKKLLLFESISTEIETILEMKNFLHRNK